LITRTTKEPPMRAITIHQPWASLLAHGIKDYETRSWPAPAAAVGHTILIHASKNDRAIGAYCSPYPSSAALQLRWSAMRQLPQLPIYEPHAINTMPDLAFGAIIAAATIEYVIHTHEIAHQQTPRELALGDWSRGRYAWRLANPQLLTEPVPCRGRQRLWFPNDDILDQVAARVPQHGATHASD
jgi:hypothetical protein